MGTASPAYQYAMVMHEELDASPHAQGILHARKPAVEFEPSFQTPDLTAEILSRCELMHHCCLHLDEAMSDWFLTTTLQLSLHHRRLL